MGHAKIRFKTKDCANIAEKARKGLSWVVKDAERVQRKKARAIRTEFSNKELYFRDAGGKALNPIDTVFLGYTWSEVKKYEKVHMAEVMRNLVDKEHVKALLDLQNHMMQSRMEYLTKNPRPPQYKEGESIVEKW